MSQPPWPPGQQQPQYLPPTYYAPPTQGPPTPPMSPEEYAARSRQRQKQMNILWVAAIVAGCAAYLTGKILGWY